MRWTWVGAAGGRPDGSSRGETARRPRRLGSTALSALVLAALIAGTQQPPAQAKPTPHDRRNPVVTGQRAVTGKAVGAASPIRRTASSTSVSPESPTWSSGSATAPDVSTRSAAKGGSTSTAVALVRAGSLPVWVGAPDSDAAKQAGLATTTNAPSATGPAAGADVAVSVLPQTASRSSGVSGPIVTVRRTGNQAGRAGAGVQAGSPEAGGADGAATVRLDYSSFIGGGGDLAGRLTLVQLPSCALTTPEKPACQTQTPVPSRNDTRAHTLTAVAPLPSRSGLTATAQTPSTAQRVAAQTTVLAAAAGVSGSSGSFAATSLGATGHWSAGGSAGGFGWSYPVDVPSVGGGLEPSVSLRYDSQSVDGRVTSTNNQPSWVGEGWDLSQGFIERSYEACSDDMGSGANNSSKTGDLCWAGDAISVSLGSSSGQLIHDTGSGQYRLREDDGTRFEKITSPFSNGDDDKEAWKATTPDGTQYFFGRGQATAGGTATNSTWTVPVFGNHSGEPCHTSSFATSYCQQAWRWNLDAVIDANGNQMSIYYTAETNHYGRNGNTGVATYNPGGYLNRIDYGLRSDAATVSAPARVSFTVAERCLPTSSQTCTSLTSTNASAWPDVPQDQICTSTTSCSTARSPAFFTRKRLVQIQTQTLSGGTYNEVQRWSLTQTFPDPGDGTSAGLWLSSVQNAAKGGANPMPAVTFTGTQLPNRVDGVEDSPGHTAPPLIKWRVLAVRSESGAETLVSYSGKDCTPSSLPTETANTRRCYPVYYQPDGQTKPYKHWFHKYVVTQVAQHDLSDATTPQVVTHYAYTDPGWRYDDRTLEPDGRRTWSLWAGYRKVSTVVGDPGSSSAQHSETLYYRGLDGDRASTAGGTTTSTFKDSSGTTVNDDRAFQGEARETTTYNGPTGPEVGGTITDYGVVATTATDGAGRKAQISAATRVRTRTDLAAGGTRNTDTTTTYDSYGYPVEVDDAGDTSTPADDECSRTSYARSTSAWILGATATTQARATRCSAWPDHPSTDHVLDDTRTYYDNLALGQVARGLDTKTEGAKGVNPDGSIDFGVQSTVSYDALGRRLTSTDALGRSFTAGYTPVGAGLPTGVSGTSADPDGAGGPASPLTTSTVLDPQWGVTLSTTGPDGSVTTAGYDAYGRVTSIWAPAHAQAAYPSAPSVKYAYTVRNNGANAVTADVWTASGSYLRSVRLIDGLGRTRQTQTQTADQAIDANGAVTQTTGRLVTDTLYDNRGLSVESRGPTFVSGGPDTTYTGVAEDAARTQTVTGFDGAGRITKQTLRALGADKWSTSYSYGGDSTTVTPPAGGTPSTTFVDADGQTTALRQYKGSTPTGAYDETRYGYTPAGKLASMTDAAGNTWRYGYDIRGHQTRAVDPDAGTTSQAFDDADQLLTSTNARGQILAYTYDNLGRMTSIRDNGPTGPLRSSFTYDTLRKGYPTSTSRVVGGGTITSAITGYDTAGNPTGNQTVVPAIEGWVEPALAGTYTDSYTYNKDGSPSTTTVSKRGNLPTEQISYRYDSMGRPLSVCGNGCYGNAAVHSAYGQLLQVQTGSSVEHASWTTSVYDQSTGRLSERSFDRASVPRADADLHYGYDDVGDVTKISTAFPQTGASADTQCFDEDYLQRLTAAWTPASGDCGSTPTVGGLGGPAPYWLSWAYDASGNRTNETSHASTGDTIKTWQVPNPGGARPHGATAMTVSAPGQTSVTTSLGYDTDGDVTARSTTAGAVPGRPKGSIPASFAANQVLGYDAEGNLTSTSTTPTPSGAGVSTQYAYDTDGTPLVRRDGKTTSLWVGGTELDLDRASATVAASETVDFDGHTVAVRTGPDDTDVYTVWSDLNGTAAWQVDNGTGALAVRRTLPFGQPRGTSQDQLAGSGGFVGGTNDPQNGFVRVGARDYDPATGRFLSPDPFIDPANPAQWNAYAYGSGSPVSHPDPSGLMNVGGGGGAWSGLDYNSEGYHPRPGGPSKVTSAKGKSSGGGTRSSGGSISSSGSFRSGGTYRGGHSGSYSGHSSRGYADRSAGTSYRQVRPHPYVAPPTVTNAWRAQPFDGFGGSGNPLLDDITLGNSVPCGYQMCPTWSGTPTKSDERMADVGVGILAVAGAAACVLAWEVCGPALVGAGAAGEGELEEEEGVASEAGGLAIEGSGFSESEMNAAKTLASQGRNVVLREADSAAGKTSDLVVDGVDYDVYTPTTSNIDRIVGNVASKGSQVRGGGIVIDLSKSDLTPEQLGDILPRVQKITGQVSKIIVMKS